MSQSNTSNPKFRFLVAMLEETDQEFMAYYDRCMKTKLSRPCWNEMLMIMFRDIIQAKYDLVDAFPPETWSKDEERSIQCVGVKALKAAKMLWPEMPLEE